VGLTKTHKRMLGAAGSIAVVVLVFVFVLPRIADYRDVFDVVRDLGWQDWALLAGAVVLNLATFPPPWMASLPGLGYREGMAMTQASTALSIVSPAGAAVGMAASYSMLRSWKFPPAAVGLAQYAGGRAYYDFLIRRNTSLALTPEQKSGVEDPIEMQRLADALPVQQAASRWIVSDDPDEHVEKIKPYLDLGFRHLVFHAPGPDQKRFLNLYGEQVLPRLRALGAA